MAIDKDYGTEMEQVNVVSFGRLADYSDTRAVTCSTDESVSFGQAVKLKEEGVVEVMGNDDTFFGVALAKHYYTDRKSSFTLEDVKSVDDDMLKYDEKEPVSVLRKGVVWVPCVKDVSAGEAVAVDDATGYFTEQGEADSTNIDNAVFLSDAVKVLDDEDEGVDNDRWIAKLEINLPA